MPGLRPASLAAAVILLIAPPAATAQTAASGVAGPAIGYAAALLAHGDLLFVGRTAVVAGFPMPSAAPGAVYVYRRSGSEWVEMAVLRAQEGAVGDGFGSAIAYDGTLLAIGAPSDAKGKGAVYIFARGGASSWRQLARLVVPDAAEGDRFGASVALQGNTALFGAPGREAGKGAAWVARSGTRGWALAEMLAPADRDSAGAFGRAVALVAPHAFVSAPGPQGGAFGGGAAPPPGRIYAWSVGTSALREAGRLTPADTAARAFGAALAFSGEVLFAGAPATSRNAGAVFRYTRQGGQWIPAGVLRADSARPGSGTGAAIALAGSDVLVGAPTMRQGKGSILVFRESDGRWKEAQQLEPRTTGLAGLAGSSLAASGNFAIAGAPFSEFFEGIGFVYAKEGTSWTERARLMDAEPGLPAITGSEHRCDTGSISVFRCQQVDLLSFIPTRSLGAPRGIMLNDIWGWTDPETKREYALVGRMDGTAFVDVTDPSNPVYVAEVPLTEGAQPNLWRDIKVYRNHAYIVSDGAGPHGMQVFDLTRLRDVAGRPATLKPDTVYHGIHSAHNIVINEETGYAYPVGNSMGGETCGGALHMIDIREPKVPKFAGCYADPQTGNQKTGYTHDAQCVTYRGPDQAYQGREICFNASETAVGIADVTDKTAPKALSHVSHPNNAYTHQGWLSADQRFFFVNDEGDELAGTVPRTRTVVYDVSDLDDPVVATEYLGETSASDHNLYVRGRYMFESNYVSGLRVIDIADPMHPKEVGYFDTVPFGDNTPGFAGSWSNYPYFPSGTIVVTSMREGLFVVRHRPEAPVP